MKGFLIQAPPNSYLIISDETSSETSGKPLQLPIQSFTDEACVCKTPKHLGRKSWRFEILIPKFRRILTGTGEFVAYPRGQAVFQMTQWNEGADEWTKSYEQKISGLTAKEIMTRKVLTVRNSETVQNAVEKMQSIRAGSVVVVDDENAVCGIFTERDVLNHCFEKEFLRSPVSCYASVYLSTIPDDTPLEEIYEKFSSAKFRRLPVTRKGELVGIISVTDLVRLWSKLLGFKQKQISKKYEKTMSVIVHDLRSPIYAIRAINETLLSGLDNPQEYVEQGFPKLIDDSCESMIHLIEDLLQSARVNLNHVGLEIQEQSLDAIARDVVRTFMPAAKAKGIAIDLEIEKDLPSAPLDLRRAKQVIENLLSNAVKYSPLNSNVEVQITTTATDHVRLDVIDHGQGIPKKELPYIFDELCKISSQPTAGEPSTGLGLSIVKRLVEAHGGQITVFSQPGIETRFSVLFPLHRKTLAA